MAIILTPMTLHSDFKRVIFYTKINMDWIKKTWIFLELFLLHETLSNQIGHWGITSYIYNWAYELFIIFVWNECRLNSNFQWYSVHQRSGTHRKYYCTFLCDTRLRFEYDRLLHQPKGCYLIILVQTYLIPKIYQRWWEKG